MRYSMNLSRLLPAAVLSVAALLFTVALVRAFSVDPTRPSEDPAVVSVSDDAGDARSETVVRSGSSDGGGLVETGSRGPELESPPSGRSSESVAPAGEGSLASAADQDPFRADRRRSAAYVLPGEWAPQEAPVFRPPPPPPAFQVIGTIVEQDGSGGLVLVQDEKGEASIMTLGQISEGYRLTGIELSRAAFTSMLRPDRVLQLAVVPAEERVGASDEEGQGNGRNRRGNGQGRWGGGRGGVFMGGSPEVTFEWMMQRERDVARRAATESRNTVRSVKMEGDWIITTRGDGTVTKVQVGGGNNSSSGGKKR